MNVENVINDCVASNQVDFEENVDECQTGENSVLIDDENDMKVSKTRVESVVLNGQEVKNVSQNFGNDNGIDDAEMDNLCKEDKGCKINEMNSSEKFEPEAKTSCDLNKIDTYDVKEPIKETDEVNQLGVDANRDDGLSLEEKLIEILTKMDKNRVEVMGFYEVMVEEGSKRWEKTVCAYFVGSGMSMNELSLDKTKPEVIPLWIKLCNIPLEAWTTKGISALTNRIGKSIKMDSVTASSHQCGKNTDVTRRGTSVKKASEELRNDNDKM
nr:RNA-directed DNA polymerase, eukaryota, reverse transcriptase zinc-binding domain protein [Tanacetum cinerariifolium]